MKWDPDVYLRFADHRARPGVELMSRIGVDEPTTVLDLGCGTGSLTRLLKIRWPGARVVGVDSSSDMLDRARLDRSQPDDIEWIHADIRTWEPSFEVDVVFSNATLHWLDDHSALFPRIASWTRRVLAVQMPANWGAPTHQIPARILDEPGWPEEARSALMRDQVGPPESYREYLPGMRLDMWTTTYHQTLEGGDPVLTWVEGSVLRPVLDTLSEPHRTRFRERCAAEYRWAYPPLADGSTVLAFSRFFVVAER